MASSKFYIPTTLTTNGGLINVAGAADGSNLVYSSSAPAGFVSTTRAIPIGIIRMYASNTAPLDRVISTTGTVGSITGTGPWTATITGMSSTSNLAVGDAISATAGTGTLFGGAPSSVVVASIVSSTSITYTVTGGTTPTAGTVTNIGRVKYLLCAGQSLNTYTYRHLHAVISNKYGGTAYSAGTTDQVGAGTTFTVPNFIDNFFPYGNTANTSLPTTADLGPTTANISHSHGLTINRTAGSGDTNHAHTSSTPQDNNHTHNWSSANSGSHSHNWANTSVSHDHTYVRTGVLVGGTTGGASGNHTHNIGGPTASHNHNVSNNGGHSHGTSNEGGNHSAHNYDVGMANQSFGHSHAVSVALGIFFYIRFQ